MGYKEMIIKMLEKIDDSDVIFLNQIYTIIKKHIEKKRVRNDLPDILKITFGENG